MGATGASRLLGGPRGLRPRWGAASTEGPPSGWVPPAWGDERRGHNGWAQAQSAAAAPCQGQARLLAHGARRGVDPGRHPRVRP